MAEFKLGRLRFIWKDAWAPGITYTKDDVVRNGGKTYLCVAGHTSAADFYTDLSVQPARWNQVSDGQEWKGDWATSTFYKLNDIVRYGGTVYICGTSHTSAATDALGLEADQGKWAVFARNFDWKTDWAVSTRYKINDIVKYGGQTYICNTGHTSAGTATLGLEADQGKWDLYVESFNWSGDWATGTRYRVNDVVKYGGQTYVCKTGHTSAATAALGLEADQAKWDYLHKGFEYKGNWSGSSVRYKVNDVVKFGSGLWICVTYHTSTATFAEANWTQFVEGIEFENSWSSSTIYQPGDVVTYGGYAYVSKTNHTNQVPTANSDDWDLFSTGFKFIGDWSGATAYKVGDVVRLGGYTYVATTDGTNQEPPNAGYWQRLNSGFRWIGTWADATAYKLGDVVKYGPSSFVCVQVHTSATATRPDNDVSGLYWNLLAAGSEVAVLTTQGDLVYYGGAGATRLPIGAPGKVLKVSTNVPTWDYFGVINQIYYVSPTGVDSPAPSYGVTIDRPWKTVRYATQQVERGARNPYSSQLLEINRQFIQAEVTAWISAQISGNISPFTSGFTYDVAKCERDIGYIIDAILWDIRHGGNQRSYKAAYEYVYNAPAVYSLGQKEETVAAINRMLTLIDSVISNATVTALQATIAQITDTSLVEEATVQTEINTLVTYITTAITNGTAAGLGPVIKPNTTINVKTGTYYETLPIVVPAETAVVGDELRSTNIRPAGSLIAAGDVAKSLDGLTRLKAVIANVVTGASVTKTPSNTKSQTIVTPYGTGTGTTVQNLVQNAYDQVNKAINNVGSYPALTGTNTPTSTAALYAAARLLELNKEFLAEEVTAYITATYPAYTYDVNACKRDVREYIDAFKYDLVYTGNYRTLRAANMYINAVKGSTLIDMFYVRNGTGLRNCTLQGLTGDLGTANAYGTKRPTAGAYVSLDPGWGTADTAAWITNKSPYVQNVTTFGTGCVGLKVDGALHAGGNDSIVANDFTQVLSDGIGAWVTNLGRAELVSVFSYYGHIGYLAENGGKIRATNGNSSYGTYGCVSEGMDSTETPITAVVDNRYAEALVTNVVTNGIQVQRLEFFNAGVNYSSGSVTINGAGAGAAAVADEFRDQAVFEVRLTDPNGQYGGADYVTASNVAQGGNSTSITLAATDQGQSSTYVGMRIQITSGTGAGQFGYITSYNAGSKVAQVSKDSTGTAGWDHVIPGTPIATALDLTTTYIIEPRLTFTTPSFSTTAAAISSYALSTNAIAYGNYVRTYTNVAATGGTGTGATFNVSLNGAYYEVTTNVSGTGYALNATLTISGSLIGGANPANNITITVTGVNAGGAITGFTSTGTGAGGLYVSALSDGTMVTTPNAAANNWSSAGSTGLTSCTGIAYGVISGRNYWVAVSNGTAASSNSTPATAWTTSTLPSSGSWRVVFGNDRFVALNTTTGATAYSTNATSWTAGGAVAAGSTIAYGGGKFVILNSSNTTGYYSTNGGVTWTSMTTQGSSSHVTFGNNKFVAVTGTAAQYSLDGITWYLATTPAQTWTSVAYGQGLFAIVAANTTAIATSEDGVNWTSRSLTASSNWVQIAFGNNGNTGRWVVVPSTGTNVNYFSNIVRAKARAKVVDEKISEIRIVEPGSGYSVAPTMTIDDPNNTIEAPFTVRIGNGVFANPTFTNRGSGYLSASVTLAGNGSIDVFQPGTYVYVKNLTSNPTPGSNIQFNGNSNFYKLVSVTQFIGSGPYTARLQISPQMTVAEAPAHETSVTLKIKYSQVRLTGHDFLDVGTGNFANTNYPGTPLTPAIPANETKEYGGGRVFYTSTDQDGNFRVGTLFSVEQATGVATLNADAFNIAGLNELTLGAVALGGSGATITEFSTDPFFTADSDAIVPTQRAIKAYITSQIGGGGSSLNVNTLTAGEIYVANDTITTTTGNKINVTSQLNLTGGISGAPVALNYFLLG